MLFSGRGTIEAVIGSEVVDGGVEDEDEVDKDVGCRGEVDGLARMRGMWRWVRVRVFSV